MVRPDCSPSRRARSAAQATIISTPIGHGRRQQPLHTTRHAARCTAGNGASLTQGRHRYADAVERQHLHRRHDRLRRARSSPTARPSASSMRSAPATSTLDGGTLRVDMTGDVQQRRHVQRQQDQHACRRRHADRLARRRRHASAPNAIAQFGTADRHRHDRLCGSRHRGPTPPRSSSRAARLKDNGSSSRRPDVRTRRRRTLQHRAPCSTSTTSGQSGDPQPEGRRLGRSHRQLRSRDEGSDRSATTTCRSTFGGVISGLGAVKLTRRSAPRHDHLHRRQHLHGRHVQLRLLDAAARHAVGGGQRSSARS